MEIEAIITALKKIIGELKAEATYVPKYGGEIIEVCPNNPKSQIGGIFAYSEHVSLEFSQGASLNNSRGFLEGKGKHRRHLKFNSLGDVETKFASKYLQEAIKQSGF